MSFPRYPEYKDSGVEWLGVVPAHWKIQPLKFVTTCNDDVLPDSTPADYQLRYVEISDVDEQSGITGWTEHVFASAPSRARRMVRHGDVLISTVRTYLRAIAPVLNPPENLVASTGFAAIRPIPGLFQSGLLGYILRADWFISNVIARSVGVSYPGINATDLIDLPVPTPSSEEQTVIATFLDHETARIDALVAEQQHLIDLLKEKRQAVISHAVTKGLNPDVPMKDSGVEWLGEVPAHWEVTKLSYITNRIGSGKTPSGGATAYVTSGVPFIRSQNVHDQGLRLNDIVYIDGATDREMAWSRVKPLDVLINITGASIGRACQVPSEFGRANVNQHVCVIRLDKAEEVADWVAWTMKATSTKEQVKVSQTGAAREGLNFQQLAGFYICMPSLKERRTISAFLKQETARIDALVKEGESVINLLQERRSALISAAVTGKIDVRGWQPPPGSSDPTETTAMEPA